MFRNRQLWQVLIESKQANDPTTLISLYGPCSVRLVRTFGILPVRYHFFGNAVSGEIERAIWLIVSNGRRQELREEEERRERER